MRYSALLIALLLVSVALTVGTASAADTVTLEGVVKKVDGSPFPGVTITIRNVTTDDTHIVTTDASGRYSHATGAGNYTVTATVSAYRADVVYSGIVGTRTDLDFTMYEVLGTVTGQVTDGNTTLDGVLVTLTGVNNKSFSALSTKPLGAYRIDNVTPGTYMISASKDGYNTSYHSELVTLEKGTVEDVSFTMSQTFIQYAKLSGRVTSNGDPLAEVRIVLTPNEGAELVAITDGNGNYTFDQVRPGAYSVRLTKDGYEPATKSMTMDPLKGVVQDFTMKRNTLPGNTGFILDYDLSHSLTIVGLAMAIMVTLGALVLRYRVSGRPELLEKEEEPAK
ncbi:MAG: carboxypeptidase regulatory-like domain-containing protein [Methanomassiliicoccus sp.]|nr:carboxypeptidase regulatory-like domain-containing protein [Methanomassiliicoccus sp.]